MKKTFIRLLTATVVTSTLIAQSFAGRVYAGTSETLYANCYNAVVMAKSTGNQTKINEARDAQNALVGTAAEFAIGEFSKQLDEVQQSILVKICSSINKIQAEDNSSTYNEADITSAYNTIPANLPSEWRSSYSSAVDKVQKHYQQKAVAAWGYYKISGSTKDWYNAMVMFNDITNNVAFNEQQVYREWVARVCTGQ